MNHLLAFLVLSSPILAAPEVLETPNYIISVEHLCAEGCVSCNDGVTYVGKNKKTGKSIRLKGGTAHSHSPDGTPAQFWGYVFKNGSIVYFVGQKGYIEVKDGDRLLVYEEGKWRE